MYPNWLQKNIIKNEIVNEKYLKISFSQNGEDDYIRSFFWDKILSQNTGIYVDIGCYHESLYSNTKLLSLIGWTGLGIDANPDLKPQWVNERIRDNFLNYAIVSSNDSRESISLYRFHDGAINTIDELIANQWISKGYKLKDVINVPARTIEQVALEIIQLQSTPPNFLNIDIEFVDYFNDLPLMLAILDYPELLCVELVTAGITLNNFKESKEYKILMSVHYEIIALIGGNFFARYNPDTRHVTTFL